MAGVAGPDDAGPDVIGWMVVSFWPMNIHIIVKKTWHSTEGCHCLNFLNLEFALLWFASWSASRICRQSRAQWSVAQIAAFFMKERLYCSVTSQLFCVVERPRWNKAACFEGRCGFVAHSRPLVKAGGRVDAATVKILGRGAARLQWGVALPGLPWGAVGTALPPWGTAAPTVATTVGQGDAAGVTREGHGAAQLHYPGRFPEGLY
jgi:hypothetical protein